MSVSTIFRTIAVLFAVAVCTLTATLAGGTAASAAGTAGTTTASASETELNRIRTMPSTTYERRIKIWINRARARHDLRALRLSPCADGIAERWGRHLATRMEFFHQDLGPLLSRCNAGYAGEVLARGAIAPRTAVRMWLKSPGHRRILLSSQPNRIGVGAYQDARGDWTVAADFIKR